MALEQYSFGSGQLYLVPQGIALPQPVQVGTLQETSVDLAWSDKPLQGQYDAPAAIARGSLKLSGKIKAAKIRAVDFNSVVFGGSTTTATGTTTTSDAEGLPTGTQIPAQVSLTTTAATTTGATLTFTATTGVVAGQSITATNVPAGTTVLSKTGTTVTMSNAVVSTGVASGATVVFGPSVTVVNAATFVQDLGVINVGTGAQMTRVASAPATGQYMVTNGVYTFSSADATAGGYVAPSYEYTQNTAGVNFTYYRQLMGYRPVFQMVLKDPYSGNNPNYTGQASGMIIYAAGMNKLSLDFKNEDWNIPEMDFSAAADYLGRVFSWSSDQ